MHFEDSAVSRVNRNSGAPDARFKSLASARPPHPALSPAWRGRGWRAVFASIAAALLLGCATAQPRETQAWVAVWASSQQIPEPRNALDPEDLRDATLRQIVRVSRGGAKLRVKVSNVFGADPLRLSAVHVARAIQPGSSRIDPATDAALTFSGRRDVIIPAGADYLSDALDFPVAAFADIAITMHLPLPPAQQTGHPGSRTTSFLVHGDHVSAAELADAQQVTHWYQLAGVEALSPAGAAAIVVMGDSITDGRGSTTDGNDRWTDFLARRLQDNPTTRHLSVLNHGIGGNRLLNDGLGPNALARFDRDVLAQPGVRYLIVLEGVNDLGRATREEPSAEGDAALVRRIIGAYEQIIVRAHAHGVRVIGATIMPYAGTSVYRSTPESEADRAAINDWIRTSGRFDAVVDFDRIMRDPTQPDRLLAAYDSGDHLHPSPAGFRAMAEAVPLSFFAD
jgi:lysophospholipase L1-like esterase